MKKFCNLFVTKTYALALTVALAGSASAEVASNADASSPYPVIYGSVVYSDNVTSAQDAGLYWVSTADGTPSLIAQGPYALHGGICVDGIYYASAILNDVPTVKAYDLSTGNMVASYTTTLDVMGRVGYALDPLTKTVYGITYGETVNDCQFSKLTFSLTGATAEKIAPLYVEDYWLALAFDSQGQLYAISRDNVSVNAFLNRMDKATGAYTPVGKIEGDGWLYPQYKSGACIDPETDLMYVNVCPSVTTGGGVNTGYLYSVDLATATARKIYQYTDNAQIMGMFIFEKPTPRGAPGVCREITPVFTDATMKGTVAVKTPTETFDGSMPEGTVDIVVRCNGKTVGTSAGQNYGTVVDVAVDLTGFTPGFYTFSVYAENDLGKGPASDSERVWVGADTPVATSATLKYEDGTMTVSWRPVTKSVNGGYIDVDNLTYTVKRSDGSVAASGVKDLSFSEYVGEVAKLTTYYYTVEAVNGTLISAPAQTNSVTIGALWPPYTSDFEATHLDGYTVIDVDDDYYKWEYDSERKCASLNPRYNVPKNDWLITPAFKLSAGKTYTVTMNVDADIWFDNTMDVMYGKTKSRFDLTIPIIKDARFNRYSEVKEFTGTLTPAEDGEYYIGFYAFSIEDRGAIFLLSYSVVEETYPAPINVTGRQMNSHYLISWDEPVFTGNESVTRDHLVGYKVYKNQELKTDGHISDMEYQDTEVESSATDHIYGVSAIYSRDGQLLESNPEEAIFSVATSVGKLTEGMTVQAVNSRIVVSGAEGLDINIFTASGVTVYSGKGALQTVINVPAGMYIVTVGGTSYKLFVK